MDEDITTGALTMQTNTTETTISDNTTDSKYNANVPAPPQPAPAPAPVRKIAPIMRNAVRTQEISRKARDDKARDDARQQELLRAEELAREQEQFNRAKEQLDKLKARMAIEDDIEAEEEEENYEESHTPPPVFVKAKPAGKPPAKTATGKSAKPVVAPPTSPLEALMPFVCTGCYNCNWTGYTTSEPERCKLYR